jgi:ArsR family transcriptional regulator
MKMNLLIYEEKAEILKILGHPIRLCIVRGLIKNGRCNVSNMEDCTEVSQSGISQHLAKLKSAGIIKGNRNGNVIFYEVINENVKKIIEAIFEEELK